MNQAKSRRDDEEPDPKGQYQPKCQCCQPENGIEAGELRGISQHAHAKSKIKGPPARALPSHCCQTEKINQNQETQGPKAISQMETNDPAASKCSRLIECEDPLRVGAV